MTNLVIMKDQQAVTSSLQVAEVFGKKHQHVLRDLLNLKEGVQNWTDLFFEDNYVHPQNKQTYPQIIMNRDGFTLLAMGFTGKSALQFKLKYIEAFNQMEKILKAPIDNTELLLETALKHQRSLVVVNERLDQLETETTINSSQRRKISGAVTATVVKVLGGKKSNAYHDSSIRPTAFSQCYREVRELYDVASYMDIPKIKYEEALSIIPKWKPRFELRARIDHANGLGSIWEES
ncbi:Rha family transcriptional regulator [Enterococcus sp. OL5]|uniref:Rha family transcriptional regulator n=1 Tax=Enterococcus sp. OL5 TaxID=2590214 RepID=UPI00112B2A93|nr:Rha family transcriptional regulator [Enterococcus sp. OL5]TPR56268.1 phage regulatory protein [Enterococcus sp. OL5]